MGQTLLVASQFGGADYDKSIFGVIGGDPTALNGRKVQNFLKITYFPTYQRLRQHELKKVSETHG